MVLCHIWSCSSDIQFFVFQNLNLIYHPVYDRGMKIRGSVRGMTLGVLMVIRLLVLVRIRTLAKVHHSNQSRAWIHFALNPRATGTDFRINQRVIKVTSVVFRHTTKLKREEWPSRLWTKCVTNNKGSFRRSDPPSVMVPCLISVHFVKSNNK